MGFVHRITVLMWDNVSKGGRSSSSLSGDPEVLLAHILTTGPVPRSSANLIKAQVIWRLMSE